MTDNEAPGSEAHPHVNFDAPAILRKWPSFNNQRRTEGTGPYLLLDGTLDQCIRDVMAKPAPRDTYVRFIPHRSPRWWLPCCLEKLSPNLRGFRCPWRTSL